MPCIQEAGFFSSATTYTRTNDSPRRLRNHTTGLTQEWKMPREGDLFEGVRIAKNPSTQKAALHVNLGLYETKEDQSHGKELSIMWQVRRG